MCGILGIAGSYDYSAARKALGLLAHRGPDNTGHYRERDVFLGHTRLSILDLSSKGNQPMSDEEEKVWITFNGEIYNFKDIRKELEEYYNFRSNTDTEVLIYAYKHYGTDFLARINGMFAFALWDKERDLFFLARDRFGKKPLYYTMQKGVFIFSSEIKAILSLLESKPLINKDAFLQYLSFLGSLPPDTIFDGIHKLPAGYSLVFDGTGLTTSRYYDILENVRPAGADGLKDVLEEVETVLGDSVRARLISDVEVGSLLSGGLDSSLVSAMYSRQINSPVHTFSIGYDAYKQYDELEYAAQAAGHIRSLHHTRIVSRKDFLEAFEQVIYHLDEPVNDSACIPTYLLAQLVKDNGIKVILTGEGSDEAFLGYDLYFEMSWYYALQENTREQQRGFLSDYFLDNFNLSKRWEYFRRSFKDLPIFRTIGENFTDRQKKLLLDEDVFRNLDDDSSFEFLKEHWENFRSSGLKGYSRWLSYIDFKVWIPEILMSKIDRMTMAHSIESRAPFLDHRLVELAFSVDCALREGSRTKAVLKPIAEKYIPEKIVHRQKKGFSSPHLEWFYEYYGEGLLKQWQAMNKDLGWFNNDFLVFLYNEGKNGRFKQHVWSLIVFERWFKGYCRGN